MLRVALTMLLGDRATYIGLVLGIAFTSFLVTFAASYLCGFMTRGFALVAENPGVEVWVMDPAVSSAEQTINLPDWALPRTRGVAGVALVSPLLLATAEARLPDGTIQSFQVIGVDDTTLAGAPVAPGHPPGELRLEGAAMVDPGGTEGKLLTPAQPPDHRSGQPTRADAPRREMAAGDALLVNDHLIRVVARTATLPRFPPRPLLYTTLANAARMRPPERHRITFVLVRAAAGVSPADLAALISARPAWKLPPSEVFAGR